jgi:hypothetical protein
MRQLRRLDDKKIRAGEERGTKGVKAMGLGKKEEGRLRGDSRKMEGGR